MLKMNKLTDYGTLVLVQLAKESKLSSAHKVARATHLGRPTVSKLLKTLAHAGLVVSERGARGGYTLARPAVEISAAEIIDALEGPVAITECSSIKGRCDLQSNCQVSTAWQKINFGIRRALSEVSLVDLQTPVELLATPNLKAYLASPTNPKGQQ